jgi:hypothetical protein
MLQRLAIHNHLSVFLSSGHSGKDGHIKIIAAAHRIAEENPEALVAGLRASIEKQPSR